MRVLQTSYAGALSPVFTKINGMPAVPDTDPTVTAARLDGTVLTAPVVVAETELEGRYYAQLDPDIHTDQVDRLKLVWTATVGGQVTHATQYVWVVSDMLVRPAELYAEPDMNSKPPWLLSFVCESVNDYAETYCNKAFGLRVDQEVIRPRQVRNGSFPLRWGFIQGLLVATGDDNDVLSQLDLVGSVLTSGGWGWPWDVLTVTYLHGQEFNIDSKLRWEALQAARQEVLARSARSPRQAISETTAGVVVRYSTPDIGAARPTGYLTLDPVLEHERLPIGFA